jgi:hypothetical protein
MAAADLACRRFHGAHDVGMKRRPGHPPVVLELVRDALALRRVPHDLVEPTDPTIDVGIVGVAHVDRQADASRDRVRDVGPDVEAPDGRDHVASDLARDLSHAADHLGRRHQCVVANSHRRRPRMILHAVERQA